MWLENSRNYDYGSRNGSPSLASIRDQIPLYPWNQETTYHNGSQHQRRDSRQDHHHDLRDELNRDYPPEPLGREGRHDHRQEYQQDRRYHRHVRRYAMRRDPRWRIQNGDPRQYHQRPANRSSPPSPPPPDPPVIMNAQTSQRRPEEAHEVSGVLAASWNRYLQDLREMREIRNVRLTRGTESLEQFLERFDLIDST